MDCAAQVVYRDVKGGSHRQECINDKLALLPVNSRYYAAKVHLNAVMASKPEAEYLNLI